jgi:hypothetical protein
MKIESKITKSDSIRLFTNFEKSDQDRLYEVLFEDQIEFGQNIVDMQKYNKFAYEASDSEDEIYEQENKGTTNDGFPSISVYHDIGPLSRHLLKIKDDKQLRKKLAKSYMHNYVAKLDTKELSEDLLVS